jgi:hypothetical protein
MIQKSFDKSEMYIGWSEDDTYNNTVSSKQYFLKDMVYSKLHSLGRLWDSTVVD